MRLDGLRAVAAFDASVAVFVAIRCVVGRRTAEVEVDMARVADGIAALVAAKHRQGRLVGAGF